MMQQSTIDVIVQGFFGIVGAGGLVTLAGFLYKLIRSYYRARVKRMELEIDREEREIQQREQSERERKKDSDQRLSKIYNMLIDQIEDLRTMNKECMEEHLKTTEEMGLLKGRLVEIERSQQYIVRKQEKIEERVIGANPANAEETKRDKG